MNTTRHEDNPHDDVLKWMGVAGVVGMVLGAIAALGGAWLLTALMLSFESLAP